MIDALARLWEEKARVAVALGEPSFGEGSFEPIFEALAVSVALELTGELAAVSPKLKEELRRAGQRALLQVGAALGAGPPGEDPEDAEERDEAMRLAVELARDGLRALQGKKPQDAPNERIASAALPTPAEIARFSRGEVEPYEAAFIARQIRGSTRAQRELAWLSSRGHTEIEVRLAAKASEGMRDPESGTRLHSLSHPSTGAPWVEIYAFSDGALAAYASTSEPVRVEGEGLRTEAMQVGYWSGHHDGRELIEATVHVADMSERFCVRPGSS